MTYNKPEIAILGDAARVIQGSKTHSPTDPGSEPNFIIDFELSD